MIATCEWAHPGADRYSGTAAAAIHAFAEIPRPTQDRLIAAWERREIADTIVIDRDTIRGRVHEYAPEIRFMHFGSRGDVCGRVTRKTWDAAHVETALVVCADAICVAIPAVCSNWFVLTGAPRRPAEMAVLPPEPLPPELLPPGAPPGPEAGPPVALIPPTYEEGPPAYFDAPRWYGGGFFGGGGFASPCCAPCPPEAITAGPPPIPEPSSWALMGVGVLLMLWRFLR